MAFRLRYVWLVSLLTTASLAYTIDASCSKYSSLIPNAITEAFGMAQIALDNLQTQRLDPNVLRLIRLLFCAPGDDPATKDLSQVIATFTNIGTRSVLGPEVENSDGSTTFYCDLSRLSRRNDGWLETVSNTLFSGYATGDTDDCNDRLLDITTAFSWKPFGDHAHQITVCPWFFDWAAKKAKYTTWSSISSKAKWGTVVSPIIFRKPYAEIDGTQLLDKVLLHELTHVGGDTDDYVIDPNALLPVRSVAYGWTQCLKLARLNDPRMPATDNADTLALFGSAIRLLRGGTARYITDAGKVTTNVVQKRDGNGTNPEFEELIEALKDEHAAIGYEPYYQDA